MKKRKTVISILQNTFASLLSLIMLLPIFLVLVNSLKSKGESAVMGFKLPEKLMWENYTTVIDQGKLIQSFFNSMTYSLTSVLLIVLLGSMTAYVLARRRTKLHNALYIYIVLGLTLSVNHIALINILQFLNLFDTRLGIILLYTAIQLPFAVFVMYGFINTVPRELDEAGVVDGCKPMKLFFSIIFPIMKPAIVSIAILNFLNTWNEFTLPLYYLNSSTKWPMTNSVYTFYGQYYASWNLVSADIILTSLPVVVIYLLGQKYIVDGMAAGAIKG